MIDQQTKANFTKIKMFFPPLISLTTKSQNIENWTGNGSLLHERHFCTSGHFCTRTFFHEGSLLHGDSFARRVAFARVDTFAQRHFAR